MIYFLIMKLLKCLLLMEYVDIGLLRPSTITLAITEVIISVTMVELYLSHKRSATIYLPIVEFIILVLIVEVELGLNIPATLPLGIVEQDLMLTEEMDICLRPVILPCASQEVVVYFLLYHFLLTLWMKMSMNNRDVYILVMDIRSVIPVVMMVTGGEI